MKLMRISLLPSMTHTSRSSFRRERVWSFQRNLSSTENKQDLGPYPAQTSKKSERVHHQVGGFHKNKPILTDTKWQKVSRKGDYEISGGLAGATTNFYVAVRLVVDASENYVLSSSLWLLPLSRTRCDWQHQQAVPFSLKELCHLQKEVLIQ